MNYLLDSNGFFVKSTKAKLRIGQRTATKAPPAIPQGYRALWKNKEWELVCMVPLTEQEARAQRERMLICTDWTMLEDSPLTAKEKGIYKKYRQALRDLPTSELWPNVVWPKLEDFEPKRKPASKKQTKETDS